MTVYIVDACRTPVGRYRGALSSVRPDDLAACVMRALLDRNENVPLDEVEEVVFGAANQAGEDNRNVGRMAALLAGLPVTVAGSTVNRLCASGLNAVVTAASALADGRGRLAIAGGVESMSRAPFVLPRPDERLPKSQTLYDTVGGWRMTNAAFPDAWTVSMGRTAENLAREFQITRREQDEFALESHRRAIAAQRAGAFRAELVSVPIADGTVGADEGPRADTSLERLAALPAVFEAHGSVTAGNSSSLNDGAAAVLLATEDAVDRLGLTPLARIVASAAAGVEPDRMGIGPVPATNKALARARWDVASLELVELNEAFAAQALAVLRLLDVDPSCVNCLGGAIALGHPLGCSGARLVATLAHQLARSGAGRRGAVTMCVGVGQGETLLLESI
jgi:acetyl-CoA acetyltransferase family protein